MRKASDYLEDPEDDVLAYELGEHFEKVPMTEEQAEYLRYLNDPYLLEEEIRKAEEAWDREQELTEEQ